jgi:co-chaperonin GroES (HSP10)
MLVEVPKTLWTPVGTLAVPPAPPVPAEQRAMIEPAEPREHVPDDSGDKGTQLPIPSGYRLLCFVPEVERTFGSGLQKADMTIEREELLATVLFVAKIGPDAYKDEKRFPSGPWCKEGDFVLVRPNAGTRVKIHGRDCRLINDDTVEAVVQDPRGISRSF